MRKYDELIEAGNRAQIEKLKMNEHKPGFDDIDLYYEFKRMQDELEELSRELFYQDGNNYRKIGKVDCPRARHEAADLANRAFIFILECDRRIESAESR